jgi:hypothetical protein
VAGKRSSALGHGFVEITLLCGGKLGIKVGVMASTLDSHFWQPWQCLDSIADRLKLVMAVKRVHVNRGMSG